MFHWEKIYLLSRYTCNVYHIESIGKAGKGGKAIKYSTFKRVVMLWNSNLSNVFGFWLAHSYLSPISWSWTEFLLSLFFSFDFKSQSVNNVGWIRGVARLSILVVPKRYYRTRAPISRVCYYGNEIFCQNFEILIIDRIKSVLFSWFLKILVLPGHSGTHWSYVTWLKSNFQFSFSIMLSNYRVFVCDCTKVSIC